MNNSYLLTRLPKNVRKILTNKKLSERDVIRALKKCRSLERKLRANETGVEEKVIFLFKDVVVKIGSDAISEADAYKNTPKWGKKYLVRTHRIPHGNIMERVAVIWDMQVKGNIFGDMDEWDVEDCLQHYFREVSGDAHCANIGINRNGDLVLIDFGCGFQFCAYDDEW